MAIRSYLLIFSMFFLVSVAIGIANNYSPVPFWDMWNAYLDFYIKSSEGNLERWVALHNEHRIVLSRILFWIDIKLFGGSIIFLLIMNFILMLFMVAVFYLLVWNLFNGKTYRDTRVALTLFIVIIVFSWMQHENITWGFQSQFFLAYSIPLLSFLVLGLYSQHGTARYFLGALVFGVLSVFTMGNGVLVLPLLVILSIALGLGWIRSLLIACVGVVTLYCHYSHYGAPPGHGSLSVTLTQHTGSFILYVLTYLGNPFYYMLGKPDLLVPQLLGAVMIGSCAYFTFRCFVSPSFRHPMVLVLLAFLLFIGGSVVGTAGGRAVFGISQALSSRYTTPAIMAWASLFILVAYAHKETFFQKKYFVTIVVLVPVLLLPYQLKSLKPDLQSLAEKEVAALALAMQVRDHQSIKKVFPVVEWALDIAKRPSEMGISVFGAERFRYAQEIGKRYSFENFPSGFAHLDQVIPLEKGSYRIEGWFFSSETRQPGYLLMVDDEERLVGIALAGFPRPDVVKHFRTYP